VPVIFGSTDLEASISAVIELVLGAAAEQLERV
jgi:hypothetical protein